MERTLDIIPVSEWGFFDESIPPLVIAGPCSAACANLGFMFLGLEYGSLALTPDLSRVSVLPVLNGSRRLRMNMA